MYLFINSCNLQYNLIEICFIDSCYFVDYSLKIYKYKDYQYTYIEYFILIKPS